VTDLTNSQPSLTALDGQSVAGSLVEASVEANLPSDSLLPVADPEAEDDGPPFDLAASIMRLKGELRRTVETMTIPQFALGMASLAMAAGLALLPPPVQFGHLLIAVAAIVLILTVAWAPSVNGLGAASASPDTSQTEMERVVGLIEGLDHKIEHLKDAQWELSETESRYRDLLDAQDDVIVRRDDQGRMTFANRAFARVFGVDGASALGQTFQPVVHEGESPASAVFAAPRRTYTQRIETAQGARWFTWDEQRIVTASADLNTAKQTHQFQSAGRDITHERQAQTELAEARDAAQAASRAKSRFLAVMSHEIRTPMNGILGMTSLLDETQLTPEQETYNRAVGQSAKTLLSLIDEILDFSKIEAGRLELRQAPFILEETVQGVIELLAPRAHDKGLEIAWNIAPTLPRIVVGDEARIRQILINLTGNAIKFTDIGGVTVEVGHAQGGAHDDHVGLCISVEDTGIGIVPEAMVNIFSEFEQAGPLRTRRHAGTGLGLSISKHLSEAMGGTITAQSRLGAGSRFDLQVSLGRSRQAGTIGALLEPLKAAKRVLLALEPGIEGRSMAKTLTAQGCMVELTNTADAQACIAVAAARQEPFDVLMVDAAADVAQAGALLAQMRHGHRDPAVASRVRGIIAIKASQRDQLDAFRSQGFGGYLVRPVRGASLLAQVSAGGLLSRPSPAPAATIEQSAHGTVVPRQLAETWRPNVLLAEDNDIGALLACAMLDKSGCDVTRVRTGSEAIEAHRQACAAMSGRPYDLILMDVHMPEMDGLEATRHLLSLRSASGPEIAQWQVPPIVALTANAFSEDRMQCLAAGMVDYLAKPFIKSELLTIIEKWCRPADMGRGHGGLDDTTMATAAA
jgi:two-component system, sensor histidine kinase and response regulator